MPYSLDDAIQDCLDRSDTPSEVMCNTFPLVWDLFTKFLAKTLKAGKKGVNVTSFGKFTRRKGHGAQITSPVFVVSDNFLRSYGINSTAKPAKEFQLPCIGVNYAQIAIGAQVERDFAKTVVETVLGRIGEVIGNGTAVKINIGKPRTKAYVGYIVGDNRNMVFRFASDNGKKMRNDGASSGPSFSKNAPASALGLSLGGNSLNSSRSVASVRAAAVPQTDRSADRDGGGYVVSTPTSYNNSMVKSTSQPASMRKSIPGSRTRGRKAGTRVESSTLKKSHFDMMSERDSKARAAKQEDYDDFKQTIDKLEQESMQDSQRQAAKRAQAREISQFQLAQAADRSKANFAETLEFKEKQEQKWPFRTEEQVKQEQSRINNDFRDGLDTQMMSSGKSLGLSTSGYASKSSKMQGRSKLKSSMASTHNVFPKFLNPEKKVHMAHYTPPDLYQATMNNSFNTLDTSLNKHEAKLEEAENDILKRKERSELLHKKREVEKMRERKELNEFLKEQARYKQKLDHDYEHERFYGKDPDPSLAYPMQRKRDLYEEGKLKNNLKDALDRQVHEKQSKSMEYRRQEVQEDKFFVDCVGEALREDRSYRMQKVADEKSLLCQSWDQQKSYNQRLKTLQQRHDGKS